MPLAYSHDWYSNNRILTAEDTVLEILQDGKPHTVEEFLQATGENKRMIERVLAAIRGYAGYSLRYSKKTGVTTYVLTYNQENDPWRYIYANQV